MYFIDSFDVTLSKKMGDGTQNMHLAGRGLVDAMASPKYMRNIEGMVSVNILFEYFQCPDSIDINDAIQEIKKRTGIVARIEYLREGSGGTRLYGIAS